ncbi:galactokinase [Archangium violaceum]|uniref:Galactokinase n=1 Tax=Archangium violaceum Cb vi76 TaxID=1406225 RepID=A0A084SGX8_9BACT|nr:galactokinase [Archangium violaceum]KFA87713.1 galactokinase [Archangium violaceum Cb vi76]
MTLREQVEQDFRKRFGAAPTAVVRSPGRVNLIGEHTDYNDGFVLPIAIDREVWIALRPRDDRRVVVHSLDYDASLSFELGRISHTGTDWSEYVKGVAWALQEAGHTLRGLEAVMTGNVPRGAGLSSSAAVEMAMERAFATVSGLPWKPSEMALLGQRVENKWMGVNSGIMDQMIVAGGRENHALLIDCRSLSLQPVPVPTGAVVVVLDTGTRRGLVDSAYNERRGQCEQAARFFGVKALRDVDSRTLSARQNELDPLVRRRARHVITENERTLQAAEAMRAGDLTRLGKLMDASHDSLRDDFEVTNDALNTIVSLARAQPGCFGARMTGAGFGGCAVALVAPEQTDAFVRTLHEKYTQATGNTPHLYVCHAADGASVLETHR